MIRRLLAALRRGRPCHRCRPVGAVAAYETWRAAQPAHTFTDNTRLPA